MRKIIFIIVIWSLLALPSLAGMSAPSVGSLVIDFRTDSWSGAYNQHSFTVGNVTATAGQADSKLLFQDALDGLGVLYGNQDDEIDGADSEMITIDISGGMNISGVWLTDLFAAPDGDGDGEEGQVDITLMDDSTLSFSFIGDWPPNEGNGEFFVNFGGIYKIKKAEFWSVNENNDNYSVAGFVNVPGSMLTSLAEYITDEIDNENVAPELEGSLMVKIDAALAALDKGNPNDVKVAMNDLKALINQVEAQIDKKITPEAAATIIQRANDIIAELGG